MKRLALFNFKLILLFTTLNFVQCTSFKHCSSPESKQALKLFQTYTEAFNSRDIPKMMTCFSDDFAWISIKPKVFETLVRGKAQLIESFEKYYKTYPDVKTELLEVIYENGFIWTKETLTLTSGKEKSEQFIQAVYYIENNKIQRLWYFEPPDETENEE